MVNTSGTPGPPSEAVEATSRRATSEDLGQGVVRRDHVAARAITADLLDADAINGKIITGATVQTAAEGPRIVLNAAWLRAIGANGSAIGMEPNDVYPYIYWASVDGSNQAYIHVSGSSPSDANIGINSGTFTDADVYRWRTFFGNDFFTAERITVNGSQALWRAPVPREELRAAGVWAGWWQPVTGAGARDHVRGIDPGGRRAAVGQRLDWNGDHYSGGQQAHIRHLERREHQGGRTSARSSPPSPPCRARPSWASASQPFYRAG
ncbi:hypothetical protein [Streptomyces venezuelae]|uniref:hypothetical protein n=1 Tax=Streptomyces venezuelae TaxID=54571 RepID=UPI001239C137|nr:hypothetical protein [Streptomyces venezuelae]